VTELRILEAPGKAVELKDNELVVGREGREPTGNFGLFRSVYSTKTTQTTVIYNG
jgi:hypothetical protein